MGNDFIDKAKNAVEGAIGEAKEFVGNLVDDKDLENEGKKDQAEAKVNDAAQNVKESAEDAVADAKGAVEDAKSAVADKVNDITK
ncbi:CsbD family protein [Williamsia sp. CHRR-6]|uniref:CsbD family protein n=1 Tax=Williamsia sp. CHRR-6 TaxID=2835871 RepID=UPI001BDA1F2A|nr:CsbD family protein [Williamsia sp. CHRR-6]MBT0566911.1 CsbD family protein [Williamsia sp. CHRR-6]